MPKALQLLGREQLVVHAVRRLLSARRVACLVVAAPRGHEAAVSELMANVSIADAPDAKRVTVVTGGAERQQSVAAALAAVPAHLDIVLVHDAARALVPVSLVEDVADAVRGGYDAVIPVVPVTDTITEVDGAGDLVSSLDRATLRAVQTPQGFRRAVLEAAHAAAPGNSATDDAGLVARLGIGVHTIPGSDQAMKITTRRDLALAEYLLAD